MRDIDKGEWRMPGFAFKTLAFFAGMRHTVRKPRSVLEDIGINEGDSVLDFFCGPGDYSIAAAELVGKKGSVNALDIHPLALETVESRAERRGISNLYTIFSDLETGMEKQSVDTVLLYGVLHRTSDKKILIREMRRILKPGGIVSISGPRMSKDSLISMMMKEKFSLRDSKRGIINFSKRR
jgi:ubiquinone/menaquinone biosynthesis C-methylase UbiE